MVARSACELVGREQRRRWAQRRLDVLVVFVIQVGLVVQLRRLGFGIKQIKRLRLVSGQRQGAGRRRVLGRQVGCQHFPGFEEQRRLRRTSPSDLQSNAAWIVPIRLFQTLRAPALFLLALTSQPGGPLPLFGYWPLSWQRDSVNDTENDSGDTRPGGPLTALALTRPDEPSSTYALYGDLESVQAVSPDVMTCGLVNASTTPDLATNQTLALYRSDSFAVHTSRSRRS